MNPHIFREYDIRGLVDKDLTAEVAKSLGQGLGTMVRRNRGSTVAVGRDCRESSTRFRQSLCDGLTSVGIDVTDIGVVPTPLTYFAANTLPVDGLAMITGSHNPPEYNRFKLGCGKTTLHGSEIQQLRQLVARGDFEKGPRGSVTECGICIPSAHLIRQAV